MNTPLPLPNEISHRHIEVVNTKTDTETSKTESNIRSTALERSVITLQSCLHGNNIFKLAAYQHRLVGCPLGVPISYYSEIGVFSDMHYFAIFALKRRLWVLFMWRF